MNCAHLCSRCLGRSPSLLRGEALTRRAVTVITAAIVVMTFAFSLGNYQALPGPRHHRLDRLAGRPRCRPQRRRAAYRDALPVPAWLHATIARQASAHAAVLRPSQLALNTSGALCHQQYGTALVDTVGPALLIGWSEVGPWMLRQIYAARPPAPRNSGSHARGHAAPVIPVALLARARELDAGHRAAPAGLSPGTSSARSCGSAVTAPAR